MKNTFKIFFATDLHGSTVCFKKYLTAKEFYKVDYLFLGGDLSGKKITFLRKNSQGNYEINNTNKLIASGKELHNYLTTLEKQGIYFEILESGNLELGEIEILEIYKKKVYDRLNNWLELAEEKLGEQDKIIAIAGNDDSFRIDNILMQSSKVVLANLKLQNINGVFNILGYCYTTPTPWDTAREKNENAIEKDLVSVNYTKNLMPLILNFHIPPKGIGLDATVALDKDLKPIMGSGGVKTINVGSKAVYNFVKKIKPSLGLFGHVHQAKGISKIGNTICINPGSVYYEGKLQGCICTFEDNKLISWQLTEG